MHLINKQQSDYQNLLELLQDRAQVLGEQPLYTFLRDNLEIAGAISFSALAVGAESLAAVLQANSTPGDRALLLFPSGLDYIEAFFACLYAGVVAVPVYSIQSPKDHERLNSITKDAGAKLILTIESQRQATTEWLDRSQINDISVLCTDTVERSAVWQPLSVEPDNLAFLQYTSGSTGSPKGVMVTHRNLLHNSMLSQQAFQQNEYCVGASWLPPYHDMGLIGGILQPLFAGFPVYLMSPMTFLKRPIRWLETITRYGVTSSGAPNFAYDFCVSRINQEQKKSLDLSSWRTAFNGAEPIHPGSLQRFYDYFADTGFQSRAFTPCYGLAEATLFVSANAHLAGPQATLVNSNDLEAGTGLDAAPLVPLYGITSNSGLKQTLVSSGVIGFESCRIVNPETFVPCVDGNVGEIWLQGDSVAKGYWNNPAATKDTFEAQIKHEQGYYLRTGDLGYRLGDQLIVTGRLKELIVVNGRNLYPQDLERELQQIDARLRQGQGAAVGLPDELSGTERLVILQEVERKVTDYSELSRLSQEVATCLQQRFQVLPYAVILISASSLPKTTSGKIQRRKALAQLQSGELKIVYDSRQKEPQVALVSAPALEQRVPAPFYDAGFDLGWEAKLTELLKNYLPPGVVPAPDQPFQAMGLDSKQALSIVGELEDQFGNSLHSTLLFDYPNIRALAGYLANYAAGGVSGAIPESTQNRETLSESLAIVGMACRFPGANNIDEFWDLLCCGGNAISAVPTARWNKQTLQRMGREVPDYGGFVAAVDEFDAGFFGISPKEARLMDPQQRLLLQTAWHAIEDAGLAAEALVGEKVGVFVGASSNDYSRLMARTKEAVSPWAGTSNALCVLANRISYLLGLNGPSLTSDTACSSSLTALHLAEQSLQLGESKIVIVAGVNLILTPELHAIFSGAGMLSPNGQCKTFDDAADGYVRGEGCGVLIVKPLSQALQDKDRIYARIDASHINQDGASNGLTAPSRLAQQTLLADTLQLAGKNSDDIDYVECHGTGTALGDPIELNALQSVYGAKREAPLRVGSVKTNIGHLEAAAGMAGLIKSCLMLYRRKWIPSLNLTKLTHHFAWERSPLKVQTTVEAFTGSASVAVSSFGFGGSNAHAILSTVESQVACTEYSQPQLMTYSARHPQVVDELEAQYQHLSVTTNLTAIAMASHQRRSHLAVRGASLMTAEGQLKLAVRSSYPTAAQPQAWLFAGQGSQYLGMGKQLYQQQATFRRHLNRLAGYFDLHLSMPLLDVLWQEPAARLNDTGYTQPALFALEVALARSWQDWGVQPSLVLGHSVGEFAAACIAGVFSEEEGIKLIAARSRLMVEHCEKGAMAFVALPVDSLRQRLETFPDLVIAAYNAPTAQVIAGTSEQVEHFVRELKNDKIVAKPLAVSHAFHSPLMKNMLMEFRQVAATIQYHLPVIPLISNISGKVAGPEIASAEYWVDHVMQPVQFQAAIEHCQAQGVTNWLEIGPGRTLIGMAINMVPDAEAQWLCSLKPKQEDMVTLLETVAKLYCSGQNFNWAELDGQRAPQLDGLPRYPFRGVRYWLRGQSEQSMEALFDVLGQRQFVAPQTVLYEQKYQGLQPYDLSAHRVLGSDVLAAANHVAAFIEVVYRELSSPLISLSQLKVGMALTLGTISESEPEVDTETNTAATVQYQLITGDQQLIAYSVTGSEPAQQLATAELSVADQDDLTRWPKSMPSTKISATITGQDLYSALWDAGYEYGPSFRWLTTINLLAEGSKWHAQAQWSRPAEFDLAQSRFQIPPGMIDSFLHMASVLHGDIADISQYEFLYLPVSIDKVEFNGLAMDCSGTVTIEHIDGVLGDKYLSYSLCVWNEMGEPLLTIARLKFRKISKKILQAESIPAVESYSKTWQQKDAQPGVTVQENWRIYSLSAEVPAAWTQALAGQGGPIRLEKIIAMNAMSETDFEIQLEGDNFDRELVVIGDLTEPNQAQPLWNLLQYWHGRGGNAKPKVLIGPGLLNARLGSVGNGVVVNGLIAGWVRAFNNETGTNLVSMVDTQLNELTLSKIQQQVLCQNAEPEIWLHQGLCQVPRWQAEQAKPLHYKEAPVALITGASGDIARQTIPFLLKSAHQRIVAVSRQDCIAELSDLVAQGKVIWVKADISDASHLKQALLDRSDIPPIQAIYHIAGVNRDAPFAENTWADFNFIAAPKIVGLLNLINVSVEFPDLFKINRWVLFSSLASVTGSYGQAHYAAANAFLDQAAQMLDQPGVSALSINWGAWKETRMVKGVAAQRKLRTKAGLYDMSSKAALAAMDRLLRTQSSNAIVAAIDWSRFKQFPGGGKAQFACLTEPEKPRDELRNLLDELTLLEVKERHSFVVSTLLEQVRQAMELGDESYIRADEPLQSLGMDSLIAVDLRNRLNNLSGLSLPATLLFDYPTIDAISGYIIEQLLPAQIDTEETVPELIAVPAELSDQNLDELLSGLIQE